MVLPNRKHISSAIWKFMTSFPAKLLTFPVCPGYWHDFGARQNLPSECVCLGQMVTCLSFDADIPRIPTLAMISSASVTSPHFGKWQLNKWAEMSALHSDRKKMAFHVPRGATRSLKYFVKWTITLLSRHFVPLRASSYEPGYRAGQVSGTDFVLRSYGKFYPGYRDERTSRGPQKYPREACAAKRLECQREI